MTDEGNNTLNKCKGTMGLYFDERDATYHAAHGSRLLEWLSDVGARPFSAAPPDDAGFLFAGARSMVDYHALVACHPRLRDRPEEREPLLALDTVLDALSANKVAVPTPRTWRLPLDAPLPTDLTFPLFVRTAGSSWKVGGHLSRVRSVPELMSESAELRRALGWDALILVRAWHDFTEAGQGVYGPVPQEVRVWIVDQVPYAWSFHYLSVVREPRGFPPGDNDLHAIANMASEIGRAFQSRLVAADFARQKSGDWSFIEAGPGSCAATAHELVFKAVAARLCGDETRFQADAVGGVFTS